MKTRVFVDGQEGTTGLRIHEYLAQRADIEVLRIDADKRKDSAERARLLNAADVAFLCLPDAASREAHDYWPVYLRGWLFWNHVRTAASLLATVAGTMCAYALWKRGSRWMRGAAGEPPDEETLDGAERQFALLRLLTPQRRSHWRRRCCRSPRSRDRSRPV